VTTLWLNIEYSLTVTSNVAENSLIVTSMWLNIEYSVT
jgi:hypothetical protein